MRRQRYTQRGLLWAWLGCLALPALGAGVWEDPNTSVFWANSQGQFLLPPPLCGRPPFVNDADAQVGFISNFVGRDYGRLVQGDAQANTGPCAVVGRGFSRATVEGLNTATAIVRWKANAKGYHICDCPYTHAFGKSQFNTTIDLKISTKPPGQTVTVYVAWWAEILTDFSPELPGPDDPVHAINLSLKVQNTQLIPPAFQNFVDTNALVYQTDPGGTTPIIQAQDGDVIRVQISGDVAARIAPDPEGPPNKDESEAGYKGWLVLSIDAPLPGFENPAISTDTLPLFSVDIGGDTEMSDPVADLDEVFDPGDLYRIMGPALPAGGADGLRDDVHIFAVDYWPQAPDTVPPSTGADTCANLGAADIAAVIDDRFDLDGADTLDVGLQDIIPPGQALDNYIAQFDSLCVNPAEYLVISYDDDYFGHYAGPGCDVPVGSASPGGATYGTGLRKDELSGVDLSVNWSGSTPATLDAVYAIADETQVHMNLAPNPDGREEDDDDVDALDIGHVNCDVQYFSADHEATGFYTAGTIQPDPGDIYQVFNAPGAGFVRVIDDVIHLGLDDAVDIDAFEFAWLPPCSGCSPALALLFSVDTDDFLTPADESGGLDPAQIYASFMTGSSFVLLDLPLADDVDALATTPRPFLPNPCTTSGTLLVSDGFEGYPAGSGVASQSFWEPWELNPVLDAVVTGVAAATGLQSLELVPPAHVWLPVFSAPEDLWTVTLRTQVPFGATGVGRIDLLSDYVPGGGPPPPQLYGVQLELDADNDVVRDAFGGGPVPLVRGAWVNVRVEIDLGQDLLAIYYNGQLVDSRTWTRMAAPPHLAALGLDAYTSSGYRVDDMRIHVRKDCNRNGIPDLCDLASGAAQDCNGNGALDSCDIAAGTSLDQNGNGVPDECERCAGDCDCDGDIDFDDIGYFVVAIGDDGTAWAQRYANLHGGNPPPCSFSNCDMDGDQDVDFDDIGPFVNAIGGFCP
jgi:hypothetical protein